MRTILERNSYEIVCPEGISEDDFLNSFHAKPFDEETLEFIKLFSENILNDSTAKKFPELIALAFWMRKAHILELKKAFFNSALKRKARGTAFHIAPSNVDTIFIYSLFVSMLAGNKNIVRISSESNSQMQYLLKIFENTLNHHDRIRSCVLIVRYEHNDKITEYLSSIANVRVIWGGDETVRRIRSIPLPPTSKEITFADKFSFCIIKAEAFNSCKQINRLIDDFYNDTMWFSQNACSSTRLVVWVGDEFSVSEARDSFWVRLYQKMKNNGVSWESGQIIEKTIAQYSTVFMTNESIIENAPTNILSRIYVNDIHEINREIHCGFGMFYETRIKKLKDLEKFITKKDQTVTHYGLDEEDINLLALSPEIQGVDRIVSIGKALEFSVLWDGYNLFDEFTRIVATEIGDEKGYI